ncbi:response regulator transcription factor [Flammeovirgaceae bacterium SG7u.111]|nr:response regulator transcription factor [Flammeovirgaceae bacterium SG7u.132]WPO37152.1 response regulator transcription factor [Flammeovirgaceae bacterium SG7u.111]
MNNINILLADDHQIVIEGLKLLLEARDNFDVVGEVVDGQQVLDFIEKNKVDIVILDINMPVMDGIACAKKIKESHPQVKVIILTMYAQKSFVEEIIKIGIDGCLLKNNSGKELIDAIDRVHSGRSYYDQIQFFTSTKEEVKTYKLSDREIEIIRSLANGRTSAEIAEDLYISQHTVKTHRKNILRKLNLHNSADLVKYALNNGII